MAEFPSQSHKAREPREIQPVTLSPGRVRNEPAGRRMLKTIFLGDARSTVSSMIWESFFPNLRDNFNDMLHSGIDTLFNGQGSYHRGPSRRSGGISINNRHNPDRALGGSPSERISRSDRNNHNLKVIEIDSRAEAEAVLEQMLALIDSYDVVKLAEFYQMVQVTPDHTDYKWGWEELGEASVVHSRGFWYLDLPDPIIIK
jgi:hypothetical protein